MDDGGQDQLEERSHTTKAAGRRSASGSGILARFSFAKTLSPETPKMDTDRDEDLPNTSPNGRAIATALHQQNKTRRRRGSLRKVALLGGRAQRDRKDSSPLTIDTSATARLLDQELKDVTPKASSRYDALGLEASDITPRAGADGFSNRSSLVSNSSTSSNNGPVATDLRNGQTTTIYTSTTDEEDSLRPSHNDNSLRAKATEPGSYFDNIPSSRRSSFHQAKSPLSYSGLSTAPLPPQDNDWDYSDTEWWGWVVLIVTWVVFVVGMGSCLDVWSWAWDIGKTPYAPPELEDDPTLPIVGYYPALIILTGVMAWVWVVVAWVGMKYFRHAKISGD